MYARLTLLVWVLAVSPAAADSEERQLAAARLATLVEETRALQTELEQERDVHQSEVQALRQLDLDLQETVQRSRELEQQRAGQQLELDALHATRTRQMAELNLQAETLAMQVRAAWKIGREPRIKLLLNQDDFSGATRLSAYFDYLARAQAQRVGSLKAALAGLDATAAAIAAALREFAVLAEQLAAQHEQLRQGRAERASLLAELERRIGSTEARLAELARDQADLERLLERLDDVLADIPADLGGQTHPRSQKGRLPMPLGGRIRHAFGETRGAGLKWQGWQIQAEPGTEVHAIAHGRVAYSDWLRGYGLLIIIDHGEQFLSLYGHNESLLLETGAWVDAGTAIATTGVNPEGVEGLYFELRNGARAIDPAAWIKRP